MGKTRKKELCCIFNYAPLYRTSVYSLIDREYDARFFFGDEPVAGKGDAGIAKMDVSVFSHPPGRIRNRVLPGRIPWRSGIMGLPFRFRTFLISGDFNWAYSGISTGHISLFLPCAGFWDVKSMPGVTVSGT